MVNSVLTRSKARKEEEDVNLDQEADVKTIGMEFDFDDTLFEQTLDKTRKTRRQKRQERLRIFADSTRELKDEVPLDRTGLLEEQKKDVTLRKAWKKAEDGESSSYVVSGDVLYHCEEQREGEKMFQLVVPTKRRQHLVRMAHGSPLTAHLGRKKTTEKLLKRCYWPGLSRDVRDTVRECV